MPVNYQIKPAEYKRWCDYADELETRAYASLFRALERAPIENRLPIFRLAARFAAEQLDARRRQAVDDLWTIADETGLARLLGASAVQGAIAAALDGGF
jgi:hypothetical protein